MIIKTKKEKYKVLKYLALITPENFAEKISKNFEPSKEYFEKAKESLRKPIISDEIYKRIVNSRTLTFGVTHNCNLRCRYCVYGGKYKSRRTHNTCSMEMDVYKKAIDFFVSLVNSPFRSSRNDVVFSFYGGEPLLEFNKILRAFDYASNRIKENPIKINIKGIVNTNGVLLNIERLKELFERNFKIDISLDGPKDQHDKFRIKLDGTGSFDDIIKSISDIKQKYPEQYNDKIRYFLTIHPSHDIKKIEEFFLSNDELFNANNVLIHWVELRKIEDKYKESWRDPFLKQREIIDNELDHDKWFYKNMTCSWLEKIYRNPTNILATSTNFTGNCFPGVDKFFIDVDGSIHICEKINSNFPIGDVNNGLYMNVISQLVNNWNKEILKRKCFECDLWWLCFFCFANMANEKLIHINEKECKRFIRNTQKSLLKFLNLEEELDENKNIDSYSSVNHYLDSL